MSNVNFLYMGNVNGGNVLILLILSAIRLYLKVCLLTFYISVCNFIVSDYHLYFLITALLIFTNRNVFTFHFMLENL